MINGKVQTIYEIQRKLTKNKANFSSHIEDNLIYIDIVLIQETAEKIGQILKQKLYDILGNKALIDLEENTVKIVVFND